MIKTIVSTALPIDERLLIRKNVLTNGTGKQRLCIVTGTHGDELEGQLICYLIAKEINEHMDRLNGTVEIYPALNPLGIDTLQRGIPNFDLDMNRIFPGSMDGSMAEQAAYKIVEDLKGADLVVDIHSSNLYLREMPQVRINVNDKDRLVPIAKKIAGIDFIWVHDAATVLEATLAHSLNSTGTPCLVAEMGVGMRINHRMCSKFVGGIFSLMNDMGMWDGDYSDKEVGARENNDYMEEEFSETKSGLSLPIVCEGDTVTFLNAEASGVFLTDMHTGIIVEQGQEIGKIVNALTGEILSHVISPVRGFLFTIRAYPIVYVGSLMARIYTAI